MTRKFLIYFSYSYALPIGKPLEEEILRQGHTVAWFCDEKEGQNALHSNPRLLENIEEAVTYKPHFVLAITDSIPDFITGLKVQIFHGFNAEKRSFKRDHFRIRGFFDLYCTQGPSTTSVFKELQQKHPHFEAIETGWSKVDPLFPLVDKPVSDKPTIFIASTFTERLSLALRDDVYAEIQRLSTTGAYRFLMVLHPKLPDSTRQKWQELENENFSFFNTTNLIPLFKQADIMFADTTSAIQEFGLQNKPIVTFNHHVPKPYLINITEADEIENSFKKALSQPQDVLDKLAAFNKELHPYTDGKSSKRVIDTCITFAQADKSHLKNKPLNLVRKYKVRKRLHYWTLKSYNHPYTLPQQAKAEQNRLPLTAIIPVGNEIHNIEEVIASVRFADEVLVVDSYTTDGTYEKAIELADRVIRRKFDYFAKQKNWAIPQAKHEWILLIDADERVTPGLEYEILETLKNPGKDGNTAYWIYRTNKFMGEPLNYSGWKNDCVIRLFQKSKCRYQDKFVHEEIITEGNVGALKNKFRHNTYITFDKYIEKKNKYAWLQAQDYDKKTKKITVYHVVFKPFWRFFKQYIIKGGFRDGFVGFTNASIQSYAVFTRYVKLWLLRKNRR